jgi:hypothetical protein
MSRDIGEANSMIKPAKKISMNRRKLASPYFSTRKEKVKWLTLTRK